MRRTLLISTATLLAGVALASAQTTPGGGQSGGAQGGATQSQSAPGGGSGSPQQSGADRQSPQPGQTQSGKDSRVKHSRARRVSRAKKTKSTSQAPQNQREQGEQGKDTQKEKTQAPQRGNKIAIKPLLRASVIKGLTRLRADHSGTRARPHSVRRASKANPSQAVSLSRTARPVAAGRPGSTGSEWRKRPERRERYGDKRAADQDQRNGIGRRQCTACQQRHLLDLSRHHRPEYGACHRSCPDSRRDSSRMARAHVLRGGR